MKILFAGIVLSLLGSLPPGLISLTVSHTAIRRGITAAIALALGAAFAEFFQAWIAVAMSDWFLSHPSVETGFKWVASLVFLALAVHLLWFAKPPKEPTSIATLSNTKQFGKGLIISAFNLMAIPYWFTYCGWLRLEGWWEDGLFYTLIFSAGVSIGTTLALSLYAWLGAIIVQKSANIAEKANRFVGVIFLALAAKMLYGLFAGIQH